MKLMTFVLLLTFSYAHAGYHRFYRGYSVMEPAAFLAHVNAQFFPLFAEAHPQGLVSYRPILLNEEPRLGLPHEIVILSFANEVSYRAYTETDIGKRIRAAHAPVFDGQKSKSLVPVPFVLPVAVETAYLMSATETYPQGAVGVLVLADPYGAAEATLRDVEDILKASTGQSVMALVAANYVVEYLFAEDAKKLDDLRSLRCSQYKRAFKVNKFVPLQKHKIGDRPVGFSQGMDAQW